MVYISCCEYFICSVCMSAFKIGVREYVNSVLFRNGSVFVYYNPEKSGSRMFMRFRTGLQKKGYKTETRRGRVQA